MEIETKTVAIIVAHPDDETLWSGGTILNNPGWDCFIASLCRKTDADRAPKFKRVLKELGASGIMGDLDDGPGQYPLDNHQVEDAIITLLPSVQFDLVISHSIYGEYTRHRRHEEIGRAVIRLWHSGRIITNQLWAFAFEDNGRAYYPIAIKEAPVHFVLSRELWDAKYNIITKVYGFKDDSWEASCTPKEEAFWQFSNAESAYQWMKGGDTAA